MLIITSCRELPSTAPDLIILHAHIWSDGMVLQADAISITNGHIDSLGNSGDLLKIKADHTQVIDVRGMFLYPGFIDSHVHFMDGGYNISSVQLRDASTKAEFINRIKAFALTIPKGQWIMGGDWNHELWGGTLPERNWIDSVTPDHPVSINRLDGHMILANSLAMKLAGINDQVKNIQGGEIPRDKKNQVIGIFKDNAVPLINKVIPPLNIQKEDQSLQAAMLYAASHGVTSVVNMGTFRDLEIFKRNKEKLITRIYTATPLAEWKTLEAYVKENGKGDDTLHWGLLKGFMDGSLGSHTAAMFEDFTDKPGDKGLLVNPLDSMKMWIIGGHLANLQIAVHAIGDRAISDYMDIVEQNVSATDIESSRFRIEHFQHPDSKDIHRIARLRMIPSMQPYHAIDDGCWAEKVIGPERIKSTYAFHSILKSRSYLAFGSDWPVAPADPILGIHAAVNRQTLDGKNPTGWIPEEKISVNDALLAYTHGGAYASYVEKKAGSIRPGYLADFVLLENDLITIPSDSIKYSKVLWTMMGGKKVYSLH
ncbi:MAG: amidohydrolase [Saprospiraceae bacterium]